LQATDSKKKEITGRQSDIKLKENQLLYASLSAYLPTHLLGCLTTVAKLYILTPRRNIQYIVPKTKTAWGL